MMTFISFVIAIIAAFLVRDVSALVNTQGPRFSASEQAALSQGEASLLGSSSTFYGSQPLWSGKKNADKAPFRGKNEDQSKSFTPRTKSNQSSFVPGKPSWSVILPNLSRHLDEMRHQGPVFTTYRVSLFLSLSRIWRESRVSIILSLLTVSGFTKIWRKCIY